jgi:choline dehydrogenase-like flavoprotein
MPEDFAMYSNTGYGIDWPFGYADLEPYYCIAEEYLQVMGDSTYQGRDWRSCPYPLEVAPYPITAGPIIGTMDVLGYSYQHMPTARNTVAVDGQAQCVTNNTCDYCPIGARFTGDQPVDALASNPNFTLITSATATQILMSSKSTVGAVQYLDQTSGLTKTITAELVFLCAGALETPKLLLASQNTYWPSGVGNDDDLVGRYLVANPYLYSRGISQTNPDLLQQELTFPTLCSRQWDNVQTQATGKFLMNMAYSAPELNPAQLMYQGDSAATIQSIVTGPVLYEIQGAFGPLPSYNNRVSLASGTNRFGLPKTLIETPDLLLPASTVAQIIGDIEQIYQQMGYTSNEAGLYPQRGDHAASTCRMATSGRPL